MGALLLLFVVLIAALVIGSIVIGAVAHLIGWLIVGLIAGYLANMLMKGRGSDLLGNLVLGIFGALASGFLLRIVNLGGLDNNLIGRLIFATLGSMLIIALGRAFGGRSSISTRY
ncbi:MAG TPA: GlsB/YeaQ/YmgE family stress response membrane protein [Chloroflexia bacterium]|nr:GlsB/YeaQ/YmgE family stress response membrane protein [Chloroflexia bacterium]